MPRSSWSRADAFAPLPDDPRRMAVRYALAYGAVTTAWVLAAQPVGGGLLFVALTTALVYAGLRAATHRLHHAEFRWRHVMSSLGDITWIASPEADRFLYINEAARRVYQCDPARFLASPDLWWQMVHPEDRPRLQAAIQALPRGDGGCLHYRIVRPDGSVRWLKDRASVIRDTDGHVLALAGVATDVTDQQPADGGETSVLRERLHGIVESAMDAVLTIDTSQRIVMFNRAAGAMFGVAPEAAIGRSLEEFIPSPHRERHAAHVAAFAVDGTTQRKREHLLPLQAMRSDGTVFPIEATISRSGDGDGLLMTAIVRDVTEEQQAREARKVATAAEAASRAKSDLLARVSHELRTPLHAVLGYSQLLAADGALQPQQRERVECIQSAGWYLTALIDDVLDLSQAQARTLSVHLADVGVHEAVSGAVSLCSDLAARRHVTLREDAAVPASLAVHADAVRLRQVLVNLVTNAVKYNRPDGEVVLSAEADGRQVRLVVRDTGLGMSPEQLGHLYEPFNRLGREVSEVEGHGIGLVLVRELVQLMGGTLVVDSTVGRGTTVAVALPRAADRIPPADGRAPLQTGDAPSSVRGRVLCIEDDPVNAILLREALAPLADVTVVVAEDGRSGLLKAQREAPDLVLVDMNLPDMPGTEVLAALAAMPQTRDAVRVALSADTTPESREAAARAGARHYWIKPFEFADFRRRVARTLAERQPR